MCFCLCLKKHKSAGVLADKVQIVTAQIGQELGISAKKSFQNSSNYIITILNY